jgi:hypothetical protein
MGKGLEPFDMLKACFWLVASIIWAQIVFGYFVTTMCYIGIWTQHMPNGACKEFAPNIFELLTGGLAAALAFSGRTK